MTLLYTVEETFKLPAKMTFSNKKQSLAYELIFKIKFLNRKH